MTDAVRSSVMMCSTGHPQALDECKAILARLRARPVLIGTIVNLLRELAIELAHRASLSSTPA